MAMTDDNLGELETCSLCTVEVRWVSLTETDAGNVCGECFAELVP